MKKEFTIVNKPRKVMRNSFLITLIMIAAAVAVGYSNIDGMEGGFALIVGFGFFALIALIVALVYIPRAREFDALVHDMNPLAHWTYDEKEWAAFIRKDLKETVATNKSMLKFIAVISLAVMVYMLIRYQDVFFIWIIAGLIALLTLVAFIAPRIRSAALKKGIHEAIIGEHAAYVGGLFQTWTHLGARLTGVDISTEGDISVMHIVFEVPTLQAWKEEIVRIPVPVGKTEQAQQVMEVLKKSIKK